MKKKKAAQKGDRRKPRRGKESGLAPVVPGWMAIRDDEGVREFALKVASGTTDDYEPSAFMVAAHKLMEQGDPLAQEFFEMTARAVLRGEEWDEAFDRRLQRIGRQIAAQHGLPWMEASVDGGLLVTFPTTADGDEPDERPIC